VLGNSVALYNPPLRVAEEFAMLDLFSRGRLIAGFPVGTAMDTTHSYSMNPGTLRPRYYEGIELIMKAWQATEPFAFNGRFNQQRYVNPVPRPWQQPHPPVWIPGGGSVETWDFCAANDYVYGALTYYGYKMVRETVGGILVARRGTRPRRQPAPSGGHAVHRRGRHRRRGVQALSRTAEYFFNRSLHVYPGFTDAPGYVTEASVRARYKSQVRQVARNKQAKHDLTWDEMVDNGYVVIGGPDTVREQLEEAAASSNRSPLRHAAVRQHERRVDAVQHQLFGQKVAPGLRGVFAEYPDPWWPQNAR
jgi:alkanesulfonate monooxygenase SsuD/methylene tetrahydromethanopterin reductase-like flavin-dependent oxidoreductase (luciferase family)